MTKNYHRCDREIFMNYCAGNLMERNAKGKITQLADTLEAEKAYSEALKRNKIILTVNGKDFSEMINYQEIKL